MQFFRSTLNKGASWHSWPDSQGHMLWSLPTADRPGDWREALNKPTKPHGNGLHAARFRSLAYWFGPCNFIMEMDTNAQEPDDHPLNKEDEDIIVGRRGHLIKALPITLEKWQDLSLKTLHLLDQFPFYYKYEGRYDQRAFNESIEHPGAYPIYQKAKMKYDWKEVIINTENFFHTIRQDKEYVPGELSNNIQSIGQHYQHNAKNICDHLDQIYLQNFAHQQSVARCEEYEHHSDAVIQSMQAVAMLRSWLTPWAEQKTNDGETNEMLASYAYGINKEIVQNINRAYRATGAEQHRLMMTDCIYTMESGVGPLLSNLPYLPEKNLNGFSPRDIAGRGVMLKIGGFIAEALGITHLYEEEMRDAKPLGPRMDKIIAHQRQISLD